MKKEILFKEGDYSIQKYYGIPKEAVTFLVRLKEIIENPEQMMFDL